MLYKISSLQRKENLLCKTIRHTAHLTDLPELRMITPDTEKGGIMEKFIYKTKQEMGAAAAAHAAEVIKQAIKEKGRANIILATGTSQFETIKSLTSSGIDFSKVTMFHLDEYIGLPADHPASFRKYLKERFVDKVPALKAVYFVEGDADNPRQECRRLAEIIETHPIDVALIGIGENGHLAFNDPPADFETEEPYIIVELDEKCRAQLGTGETKSRSGQKCPRRKSNKHLPRLHTPDTQEMQNIFGFRCRFTAIVNDVIHRRYITLIILSHIYRAQSSNRRHDLNGHILFPWEIVLLCKVFDDLPNFFIFYYDNNATTHPRPD
jgi:glucosamine-6-phosphate deaminase